MKRDDSNNTGFVGLERDTKGTTKDKLNQMPPGQDIGNQQNADIKEMPMKRITPAGYGE